MSPAETYERGRAAHARTVASLEQRARGIATARLVVALVGIGLVGAIAFGRMGTWGWAPVGLCTAAFAALVLVHAKVYREQERARAARTFHERGLARLRGLWVESEDRGDSFLPPGHPYAEDLDLFGSASLFQLLSLAQTSLGRARLAARLLDLPAVPSRSPRPESSTSKAVHPWRDEVVARQEAIRALAEMPEFREKLFVEAHAADARVDPTAFATWARVAASEAALLSPGLIWTARLVPVVTLVLFALGQRAVLPPWAWVASVVAGIVLTRSIRGRLDAMFAASTARERELSTYGAMIAHLESASWSAPRLLDLQGRLQAHDVRASASMAQLGRVLGFVEARNNEVFRFLIAPILLWDVHCGVALLRWAQDAGPHVKDWLDVVAEFEALASLAAFAFDRPAHVYPTLHEEPRLTARALGHPLLRDDRRICNDLTLAGPGHALVLTGSNMSGKSTLLRTLGINVVLAMMGAPVCAESFELGPMTIGTSMRIRDSLEEGASRFYAELKRVKLVLDLAERYPVLFLLDEILAGTNARERIVGARAIVRTLLERGALGIVSTHDMALTELETERPGQVGNVHFEEQVEGDVMSFDYKLRQGVVQSSNALRLMRSLGIDVS